MAANSPSPKSKLRSTRPDFASLLGVGVALGAIIRGLMMEGGHVSDITQTSAAIIVLGGTLGAVMITSPLYALMGALKGMKDVFFENVINFEVATEELIGYATKARKSSVISLEEDLDKISDPFLKKALTLAVDGTDIQELRQ